MCNTCMMPELTLLEQMSPCSMQYLLLEAEPCWNIFRVNILNLLDSLCSKKFVSEFSGNIKIFLNTFLLSNTLILQNTFSDQSEKHVLKWEQMINSLFNSCLNEIELKEIDADYKRSYQMTQSEQIIKDECVLGLVSS